jgi:hypothetical protein
MIPARPPIYPGEDRQRHQAGSRDRYRELRDFPATDQAIRAGEAL